jgi:isoaspartyl peptidase/L-asparaginase-like protein (Ntn-hydrolase superfamily)
VRTVLAKTVLDLVEWRNMPITDAVVEGIARMQHLKNGLGGLIAIDAQGAIAFAGNESHMSRAYMSDTMSNPVVEALLR